MKSQIKRRNGTTKSRERINKTEIEINSKV